MTARYSCRRRASSGWRLDPDEVQRQEVWSATLRRCSAPADLFLCGSRQRPSPPLAASVSRNGEAKIERLEAGGGGPPFGGRRSKR
jgi:hypothetical protein